MLNTKLLIIDAQNDFCDLPDSAGYSPALPIPGSHRDCLRLAQLIRQAGAGIAGMIATFDSHHAIDLAHNSCWLDRNGRSVPAFTPVTAADLSQGRYRPAANIEKSGATEYLLQYLRELETMGRTLMLWPPHCVIGSPGHNLHAELGKAMGDWEIRNFKAVDFVFKGENIWTESFSALQAVIPYPGDTGTELNRHLLGLLSAPGRILVAGQASSHCVRETVKDMLRYGGAGMIGKLVVLTDCMSPVPGFESVAEGFFKDLQVQGIRLATSPEIISELLADSPHP